MMHEMRNWTLVTICMLAMLLCGCGQDDEGQPAAPPEQAGTPPGTEPTAPPASVGAEGGMPSAAEVSKMAEENRQALAQMNQGKQIQAITANTLKGLLPTGVAGMEQTNASAERNQMMGIDMTIANATYAASNGGSLDVTITDAGNMSGPMRMGLAAWATMEYSRETDTGYEKTTTYSGFKAMEQYDKENQYGVVRVFVADRFVVEVEGNNVTMDAIKQALGKIDLKQMASLGSGS